MNEKIERQEEKCRKLYSNLLENYSDEADDAYRAACEKLEDMRSRA